ncbi:MAG: hypothetical protein M3P06_08720 [Acidobacteriota bacterium]|nr:hypothetical protein [Acidobacteriota bacterium]
MTSAAYRLLVFVVAATLGSQALGGLSLTPRSELYDGVVAPAMHGSNLSMTGTTMPHGTVMAWKSGGNALHVALLDSAGVVRNHSTLAIPNSGTLSSASDGTGALVLVGAGNSYLPIHVSRDGTIAVGAKQNVKGIVIAVAWNGVAYIAYAYDHNAYANDRALELNRRGEVIAQSTFPHVYGLDYRARFFAAGRIVSILRSANGTVFRATLTNEEGHVVPATWTPIPLTIGVSGRLMAANAGQFGIHVVFVRSTSPYTCFLQTLDFNGAPIGDPIVLDGLEGDYIQTRISRTPGGSIIVLRGVDRSAVVTKRRPRARDHDGTDAGPEEAVVSTVRTSNSLAQTEATLLLPFSGGALIVAPLYASSGENSWGRMPAVTRIHANQSGISFSEPSVLEYARPDTREGTATAHDDGFLVVWQQSGPGGAEIWLRKVDALGIPRGAAHFAGKGLYPKIASQGDLALVVWTSRSASRMEAVRIGRDGAPLDSVPTVIEFPTSFYPQYPQALCIGFDAMQFNVIVQAGSTVAMVRVLPSPAESAEPWTVSLNPDRILFYPQSFATAFGNTVLASSRRSDVIAAIFLRHDLTPHGDARTISVLAGAPEAAWNGEHFVIAWWHRDHYRYTRLSPSGEPLDSEFGRVLGEPVGVRAWGPQFEMLVRGEEFLIAVPGQDQGSPGPGQIASFRAGAPGEVIPLTPEATDVRALVRRPDGSTLLLTADRFGQLSVRMVLP